MSGWMFLPSLNTDQSIYLSGFDDIEPEGNGLELLSDDNVIEDNLNMLYSNGIKELIKTSDYVVDVIAFYFSFPSPHEQSINKRTRRVEVHFHYTLEQIMDTEACQISVNQQPIFHYLFCVSLVFFYAVICRSRFNLSCVQIRPSR
jgi:hypothetical protein